MSPFYLNQASTMPLPEGDEDQSHDLPISLNIASDSSFSYPILFHTLQYHDQGNRDHRLLQQQQQQQAVTQQFMMISSSLTDCSVAPVDDDNSSDLKLSLGNQYVKRDQDPEQVPAAGKWMPSKMRIMRKMMKSDSTAVSISRRSRSNQAHVAQDQTQVLSTSNESSPPLSGVVRVCSDCHTTKTPLWRSGPCGPKSLCNACGIRQRKARRAMAAAAAAAGGGEMVQADAPAAKVRKGKKLDVDRTVPFKKRCKFISAGSNTTTTGQKKLCFEDDNISLSLSTSSSFRRVFPQDETDAAILLMALSCGLVRS